MTTQRDSPQATSDPPVVRRVRHQRGQNLPIRVTVQGAVRVNEAIVVRDYGDCLLLDVDLHSKHALLDCVGNSPAQGPSVYLSANESTLGLDENLSRDAVTVVEFPELRGWRVFCAQGPGRYTLSLALTAPDSQSEHSPTPLENELFERLEELMAHSDNLRGSSVHKRCLDALHKAKSELRANL